MCLAAGRAFSQDGLISRYQARLAATQVEQPHWATPLVTPSPRVEQGFRTDFVRQSGSGGQTVWNFGNTKGLQVVPFRRVELRISPPPFLAHSDARVEDGFGDFAVRLKYRLYGSSEKHRNAIVTGLLGASLPTGKSGNGGCCAILTPTLEAGKGIGRFALTTGLGGTLPMSNGEKLGRQIVLNSALQYHATKLVWVEAELNSTFYKGGKNDGKEQTFATPGLIVSRIPLVRSSGGKDPVLLLSLGVGEQIALTHFNTYNHSPIMSVRLRF